jgi:hypothetical protein
LPTGEVDLGRHRRKEEPIETEPPTENTWDCDSDVSVELPVRSASYWHFKNMR